MVLKDILTAVIVLLLMVIIKNWINHWLSSENLVSVRVICGGGVFIFICFSSRYVGGVFKTNSYSSRASARLWRSIISYPTRARGIIVNSVESCYPSLVSACTKMRTYTDV